MGLYQLQLVTRKGLYIVTNVILNPVASNMDNRTKSGLDGCEFGLERRPHGKSSYFTSVGT